MDGARRRGSTLLIVITLMGMMMMLGFLFYAFAAQERVSAEIYRDAELRETPRPDRNYFDWGLEQLIVGPPDTVNPQKPFQRLPFNSALWGKRHSLVANMLGTDGKPFDGEGLRVIPATANVGGSVVVIDSQSDGVADFVWVDQNNDGVDDHASLVATDARHLLNFNDSPAAHNGFLRTVAAGATFKFPEPDVDYTYPDANNIFLAFQLTQASVNYPRTVVIPSFHRPQYLNSLSSSEWYQHGDTRGRVLRPHPAHVFVDGDADDANNGSTLRFLSEAVVQKLLAANPNLRLTSGFPFKPADQDLDSDTIDEPGGVQGVWNGLADIGGLPGKTGKPAVILDVDNDGDGIREGVYLDLDHPVQETSDGRKFVPLYSFTVYDADGLANLNAHGNIPNNGTNTQLNHRQPNFGLGANTSLSQSNMGVDGSEVSLQWQLMRNADFNSLPPNDSRWDAYTQNFGRLPSNRMELANMDLWLLLKGRGEMANGSLSKLHTGRYGELSTLLNAVNSQNTNLFPGPGRTFTPDGQIAWDDNGNWLGFAPQSPDFANPTTGLLSIRPRHPFPWNGRGSFVAGNNPFQLQFVSIGAPANPNRWLKYDGYVVPGPNGTPGKSQWALNQYGQALMTSVDFNALVNESAETLINEYSPEVTHDELFDTDEMAGLHLSNTDMSSSQDLVSDRLAELAPLSFGTGSDEQLRRSFTTLSFDRRNVFVPKTPKPDSNFIPKRHWEHWESIGGQWRNVFPPRFGGSSNTIAAYASLDPFRGPVRLMFSSQFGYPLSPQHLLVHANGNLDGGPQRTVDGRGQRAPVFRPITPHPAAIDGVIKFDEPALYPYRGWRPSTGQSLAYRSNTQEYWAVRDRQALARDVFVLLYTFCGGNDDVSYASVSNDPSLEQSWNPPNARPTGLLYTEDELKRMAQFAVNMIDAMDVDDVMTEFEYDVNLANGWNLDDVPSSTGDANHADRRVVRGVEAQKLMVNEVLGFQSVKATGGQADYVQTEFTDDVDRYFTYIELQNITPDTVSFASEAWQIRLTQDGNGNGNGLDIKRRLTLKGGVDDVTAGQLFTIGSTSDGNVQDSQDPQKRAYSRFKVDPTASNNGNAPQYQQIVPPNNQALHMDLVRRFTELNNSNDNTDFKIEHVTTNPGQGQGSGEQSTIPSQNGAFASGLDITRPLNVSVYRRANPRQRPYDAGGAPLTGALLTQFEEQNPWVEVDALDVNQMQVFDLNGNGNSAGVEKELRELKSRERSQPFSGAGLANKDADLTPNSISAKNSQVPLSGIYDRYQWQHHLDRPFASLIELFHIPLVGPDEVSGLNPDNTSQSVLESFSVVTGNPRSRFLTAGQMVVPQAVGNTPIPNSSERRFEQASNDAASDARWWRLLGFLEIPSQVNRRVEDNPAVATRVPGRVNLNTIRNVGVLAGLLDEFSELAMPGDPSVTNADRLDSSRDSGGAATYRNWWKNFLASRDSAGGGVTNGHLVLPGSSQSRPFRSLTNMRDGNNAILETVLRQLPNQPARGRRLWELNGSNGRVHYSVQDQLLARLMANTTTRSNVFVVFMSVTFFEAHTWTGSDGVQTRNDQVPVI
ncbi:MAG: hypothetical protein ABGZ17_08615, partial [Planctomycetaceae bacterium]